MSWTVAEHQVHPAFPVPYTFVLVELEDVPEVRLGGYIAGRPSLSVGMAMKPEFVKIPDEVTLVNWIPNAGLSPNSAGPQNMTVTQRTI